MYEASTHLFLSPKIWAERDLMEQIFNALENSINNFRSYIRRVWHRANNASHIRRANRAPSVRQRLEDTLFLMFVCFCMLCSGCMGFYFVDTRIEKVVMLSVATVMLLCMAWLYGYRNAIADSRTARIRYEERTRQTCQRIVRNIRRIIRRLAVGVGIVLLVSIALQYVPSNITQHIPVVADAADLIVDIFNNLLAKAVAFIRNHIA